MTHRQRTPCSQDCFHSGRYRSHDPVVELLSQQVSSVLFLYCFFFFFIINFFILIPIDLFLLLFFFFFFFQRGKLHKTTNAIISENFVSRENCLLQRIPALLFCRHTMKLCNILLPTPHPNPPAFLPAHSLKSWPSHEKQTGWGGGVGGEELYHVSVFVSLVPETPPFLSS